MTKNAVQEATEVPRKAQILQAKAMACKACGSYKGAGTTKTCTQDPKRCVRSKAGSNHALAATIAATAPSLPSRGPRALPPGHRHRPSLAARHPVVTPRNATLPADARRGLRNKVEVGDGRQPKGLAGLRLGGHSLQHDQGPPHSD